MKALLLKEWHINQTSFLSVLLFIAVAVVLLAEAQIPLYLAVLFTGTFLFSSNYVEEKNNSNVLINSLPVSRKQMVSAKYVISFAFGIVLTLLLGAANLFIPGFLSNQLPDVFFSITAIGVLISFYYPLYYLLGPRFIGYGFLTFLLLAIVTAPIIVESGIYSDLLKVYQNIAAFSHVLFSFLLFGVTLLCLLISRLFSVFLYKRKAL